MQRRITIKGLTYLCNVSHDDENEYWSVANAKELAEFLTNNGYKVFYTSCEGCPQQVVTRKNIRIFKGEKYFLNQCEGDLIEWVANSMVYDFTHYYDKVIFNTKDGFVAAYNDDIDNNWKF